MYLKLGIVIGASLCVASAQSYSKRPEYGCTSLTDLHGPCGCTLSKELFNPVCGSNGQTYFNECFLGCVNFADKDSIKVTNQGVCRSTCQCKCSATYDPVCANGVSYTNECAMNCAIRRNRHIQLEHAGECHASKRGRSTGEEVEEAGIYAWGPAWSLRNHCRDRNRNKPSKKCACHSIYKPVCGSNNKTYANFCVLDCVSRQIKNLKAVYWGVCEGETFSDK